MKGHLIGYQQPPGMCSVILRHGHTYLLQRAGGLLIAGSSEQHVGFDRSIDAGIVADLAARAAFLLPHLATETPTETWTGLRPASDALHTGAHGAGGRLFLAYGHFRNGILLAPVTGRDLADEISASFGKPLVRPSRASRISTRHLLAPFEQRFEESLQLLFVFF